MTNRRRRSDFSIKKMSYKDTHYLFKNLFRKSEKYRETAVTSKTKIFLNLFQIYITVMITEWRDSELHFRSTLFVDRITVC